MNTLTKLDDLVRSYHEATLRTIAASVAEDEARAALGAARRQSRAALRTSLAVMDEIHLILDAQNRKLKAALAPAKIMASLISGVERVLAEKRA